MDAFEQMLTGLAEAAELPPELLLPQATRVVPMAAAAAAIMMRRMETVLPAGGALTAPGDRNRESLPVRPRLPNCRTRVGGEAQVALRRPVDRGGAVGRDHPAPPGAVDPLERVRLEQRHRPADDGGTLRDQVGVAVHEADPAPVLDHRDDVAGHERAGPALPVRPVQHLAAVEMDAEVDEGQAVADLPGVALPELHRRVGPGDPRAVVGMDVDRGA